MMDIKMKLFNISAYLDMVKARSCCRVRAEEAKVCEACCVRLQVAYPRITAVSTGGKSIFWLGRRGEHSIFP
jgi:hypothetical protein